MATKKHRQPDETDIEAVAHDAPPEDGAGAPPDDALAEALRQRDELDEKYKRALADFRNYHQRALANEREARRHGAADVLQAVIRVLDHFDLALGQDPDRATAEQILGGVKLIREELLRAIGTQGVTTIEPAPNDEFDPHLHQAVQQASAEGVGPGRISVPLQAGYALGDRVLRPAKVVVAPGDAPPPGADADDSCP